MNRKGMIIGVGLALVLAALASLPLLLSSESIKQQAIKRLTQLTGRTAVIRGASSVSLYPYLQIRFSDVEILDATPGADRPLISMDGLETRLELFPLLFGLSEFSRFRLIRPRINLQETRAGVQNWRFRQGDIAAYLQQLSFKLNGIEQVVELGSFTLVDGIIRYQNDRTRVVKSITALNFTASWPRIDQRLVIAGSAVWNGEVVNFDTDITDPRMLIEGDESPLSASIESRPITWSFTGKGDTRAGLYLDGTFSATIASVRRLLEWTNQDISAGSSLGALSINAELVSKPGSVRFQNAQVNLDGNKASGLFEINFPELGNPPSITGTLAYDVLDLTPYFSRSSAEPAPALQAVGGMDLSSFKDFNLDMRISANSARLANIEINNIAATAQIRDGRTTIDIGDGTVFGGAIQGQLIAEQQDSGPTGELKANFSAISLTELSNFFSSTTMKLTGQGSASFHVKSSGNDFAQLLRRMNGRADVKAQNGRIEGLNLAQLIKDAPNEIILDANRILDKGTNFETLQVQIEIANGIAFFKDTWLEGLRIGAALRGRADLLTESLVLNGEVSLYKSDLPETDGSKAVDTRIPFLIGGTLSSPLIAPDFLRIEKKSSLKSGDKQTVGQTEEIESGIRGQMALE